MGMIDGDKYYHNIKLNIPIYSISIKYPNRQSLAHASSNSK